MSEFTKSLNRTLYFYKLETTVFDIYNQSNNIMYTNEYFLKSSFKEKEIYPIRNEKIVEIIKFNNDIIFGSIGKIENINNNALKQQRESSTYKKIPKYDYLKDILFEDFTYFLIGNNFSDVVVLQNSEAPLINKTLPYLMGQKCRELKCSFIHPKLVDNLQKELNKFTEILKVDIAINNDGTSLINPTIKEVHNLSSSSVEKVTASVTLKKKTSNKQFIESLEDNSLKNYSSFKIQGVNNETHMNESIDLIKKILTKKINIEISNNILLDTDNIMSILETELFANIKRNRN